MIKRSLSLLLCLAIFHPAISSAQDRSVRARIDLQRLTTFGELEGDRPVTFGLIQDLVATDSTIAVLDRRFQELRLFDLRGNHIQTLGRPGRGPGEFFVPQALARTGDDLLVLDPANARISRYRIRHDQPALLGSFPIDLSNRETGSKEELIQLRSYILSAETGALLFRQESLPRLRFADRQHLYSVVNQPYPAVAVYQYTLR